VCRPRVATSQWQQRQWPYRAREREKSAVLSKRNAEITGYLKKTRRWRGETEALRAILLDCELTEALKRGKPCQMHDR